MFYTFELMMAGVILLTAMAVGGVTLWLKHRKKSLDSNASDETAGDLGA